jgi:hypothetical protein
MRPDFPFPPIATCYLTFPSSVNWRRRSFRGDALEPGPLEVVRLHARLGAGRSGSSPWITRRGTRTTPRHSPISTRELHGPPLGIPAGVLGEGGEHGDCAPD